MSRPFLAPGETPPAEPPRFPPRPTPNTPPRRRGLLGAVAALAAAPAVVVAMPAPHPDAELLTLCARHGEIHRAIAALNEDEGWHEDAMGALTHEHEEVGDRIADLRPTTRAGMLAKARAARDAMTLGEGFTDNLEDRMAAALVDDLLALEGVA